MHSAVLRGRDHTRLGDIAAVAEGACALSLSRGGARKRYRYVDPNEDAVGFAVGDTGWLLAAADAHDGGRSSEAVVQHLIDRFARDWVDAAADPTESDWQATALAVFVALNEDAVREATREGTPESRTTLSFALIRPREGRFGFGAIGDSHVFRVGDARADDVARDAGATTAFLGSPSESLATLRARCFAGCESIEAIRALVLVTDGISERGIGLEAPSHGVLEATRAAVAAAPSTRPLVAARGVAEIALAAHREHRSGDNVGAAVAWLGH